MGRKYNLGSSSDMKRYMKDLEEEIRKDVLRQLRIKGQNVTCPKCGHAFTVQSEKFTCPNCSENITLELIPKVE